MQVANYMNGGHYNPHHDYVMKEKAPDHVSAKKRKFLVFSSVDVHFENVMGYVQLLYALKISILS